MEKRNIFDINLPNLPKSGSASVKRDRIAQDEQMLAEKKETLANLQKQVEKAKATGRVVDAYTLQRIEKLKEIIKNTQERIVREKERLGLLLKGYLQR